MSGSNGERRGAPPVAPLAPTGPVIQVSDGKAAPARTYQDLLKDPYDEALFDYHATSKLVLVLVENKPENGKPVTSGDLPIRGVFLDITPAPDGKLLLVTRVTKPYSYLFTLTSFPRTVEVFTLEGKLVQTVATLALQDKVPIEGVPTGPRAIFDTDAAAHLTLGRSTDGGDRSEKPSTATRS